MMSLTNELFLSLTAHNKSMPFIIARAFLIVAFALGACDGQPLFAASLIIGLDLLQYQYEHHLVSKPAGPLDDLNAKINENDKAIENFVNDRLDNNDTQIDELEQRLGTLEARTSVFLEEDRWHVRQDGELVKGNNKSMMPTLDLRDVMVRQDWEEMKQKFLKKWGHRQECLSLVEDQMDMPDLGN